MLVLIVPMLSVKNLNADSNYVIMRQVVPEILAQRPDWLIDILWPANSSDWTYYKDGFFDHPNIRRTPAYIDSNKMRQVSSFEARFWNEMLGFKGGYHDLIWNNSVEFGDSLKFFEPRFAPNAQTFVVNFHHYVLHDSLSYPVRKTYEHLMVRQVAAALNVDINVVNSDHCREMLLDNAREFLAPAMVDRLDASVEKISYGTLDVAHMESLRRPRHPTFTFAYNHRLQNYKQWQTTFEMFDKLWELRQGQFKVQVHGSIASDKISQVAKKPYTYIVETPNHDDYLIELSKCHANVTHSVHETFCISAIESMAFAQVLVAPKGVTFPEITGANAGNGYPYLFRETKDALGMALDLIDNLEHVEQWGKVAQDHVLSTYNRTVTAERIIDLFERTVGSQNVLESLRRPDEWRKLIGARPDWELNDLRQRAYAAITDKGTHLAAGQSFPAVKIKRLANELGYRDTWGKDGKLHLVLAKE